MTEQPSVDDGPESNREQRLAEELCHAYHYGVGLDELDEEDPGQARAHRRAARRFLRWLENAPEEELRQERRAAFRRGYDRGAENAKKSTAEDMQRLEAEVAELRKDRDPDGLRARIRDLEYALDGWDRFMTGRTRAGAAPTWEQQAAEYLAKLTEAQRELAVLKDVQSDIATREQRP